MWTLTQSRAPCRGTRPAKRLIILLVKCVPKANSYAPDFASSIFAVEWRATRKDSKEVRAAQAKTTCDSPT